MDEDATDKRRVDRTTPTLDRRTFMGGAAAATTVGALGGVPQPTAALSSGRGGTMGDAVTANTGKSLSLGGLGYGTADESTALASLSTELTIECWVKHDGESDENAVVAAKGDGFKFSFVGDGDEPWVRFWAGKDRSYTRVASYGGIPKNRWTHVAITLDGDTGSVYIDGELDNSTDIGQSVADSSPLRLGTNKAANGEFFSGRIDEFRIWDHAKTLVQVKSEMYEIVDGSEDGLVVAYSFDDASGGTAPDAGSGADLDVEGQAAIDGPGVFPLPPDGYATPSNASVDLSWDERLDASESNAASEFSVYRSTDPDGSDRTEVATVDAGSTTYTDDGASNRQTHYYEVTRTVDGEESDFSPAAVVHPAADRGGASLHLGGDGYAETRNVASLDARIESAISIECWVKHDGESDEDAVLLTRGDDAFMLRFVGDGDEPWVRFWGGKERSYTRVTSTSGIPAHEWTHLALTYDGSTASIYIDGELDAEADVGQTLAASGDAAFRVGADAGTNDRFFSGRVDDLRIWDHGRSEKEVRENYRSELVGDEAGLVANWRFDDVGADRAADAGRNRIELDVASGAAIEAGGALPVAPTAFARAGNGSAEVAWTDEADRYGIYRSTDPDGSDRTGLGLIQGTTSFTNGDLENGQTYYYHVTTFDDANRESDYSTFATVTPGETGGGTAMRFSGDESFATVTGRPSLQKLDTTATIEAWIRHEGASEQVVVRRGGGFELAITAEGKLRFWAGKNRSYTRVTSKATISEDEWTHVAVTLDGETGSIYVDGEFDNSADIGQSFDGEAGQSLLIGSNQAANERFFTGDIDDLRIWNYARSKEEVREGRTTELVGNEDGLVVNWRDCGTSGDPSAARDVGRSKTVASLSNVECVSSDAPFASLDELEGDDLQEAPDNSDAGSDDGDGSANADDGSSSSSDDGTATDGEGTDGSGSPALKGRPVLPVEVAGVDDGDQFTSWLTIGGIVLSIAGMVSQLVGGRGR